MELPAEHTFDTRSRGIDEGLGIIEFLAGDAELFYG